MPIRADHSVFQSTFCVNSLAHWLGEKTFDTKLTPGDHFFTALLTAGEGYHNFHHQFPNDYRNAVRWFQYDPTKWFIRSMAFLGLASNLKRFPQNEIDKGVYTVKSQQLFDEANGLRWPTPDCQLPFMTWKAFQAEAVQRDLIAVCGYLHDISTFTEDHPGGKQLIERWIGSDATTAFGGGVYEHSHAARNLLAMLRVGKLEGPNDPEAGKDREATDSVSRLLCQRVRPCAILSVSESDRSF